MKTFLFPGQGSQAKGMGGRPLFDKYPEWVAGADRILGYSIAELCLDDPRRELHRTQFTQPAIFVVNALSGLDRIAQHGRPDFVAGHSLGEFNALLLAGCFDFETGLQLVRRRAELMGQAAEGGMAALLNTPADTLRAVLDDNGLDQIDIANFNTPKQIVISGARHQIAEAQKHFGPPSQYIPLSHDYIAHWESEDVDPSFKMLAQFFTRNPRHREVVVLSHVYAHELNVGYHAMRNEFVERVNGRPIGDMRDLLNAVAKPMGRYHIVDLAHAPHTLNNTPRSA